MTRTPPPQAPDVHVMRTMNDLARRHRINVAAWRLLSVFQELPGFCEGTPVPITAARLGELACVSERAVLNGTKELECSGLITKTGSPGRRSCTYTLPTALQRPVQPSTPRTGVSEQTDGELVVRAQEAVDDGNRRRALYLLAALEDRLTNYTLQSAGRPSEVSDA